MSRRRSVVAALVAAAVVCTGAPAAEAALTSTQQTQLLNLVNNARKVPRTCGTTAMPSAPALKLNSLVTKASEKHALDMATKNFFSHTGSDGSNPGSRLRTAGFAYANYFEALSAGQPTASEVVAGWLRSSTTCKSLMSRTFTVAGFGYAYRSTSTWKHYWVGNFAKPAA